MASFALTFDSKHFIYFLKSRWFFRTLSFKFICCWIFVTIFWLSRDKDNIYKRVKIPWLRNFLGPWIRSLIDGLFRSLINELFRSFIEEPFRSLIEEPYRYIFRNQEGKHNFFCGKTYLFVVKKSIFLLNDYNWTRTHNHLVHKGTLNHLAKWPNDWAVLFVHICTVCLNVCFY